MIVKYELDALDIARCSWVLHLERRFKKGAVLR